MDKDEEWTEPAAVLKQQQQRREKELQANNQSMKNLVPKNDKKRRKQLTEDIVKLEAKMEERRKPGEPGAVPAAACVQSPKKGRKGCIRKERHERIAEAEIENLSGARHLENQTLTHSFAVRQLQIKQIPFDGHCMYRAIEHQLKEQDDALTLSKLRSQTADYMRQHAEDFLPFLNTANTPAWGGQLELRVIQADSPLIVREEYSSNPIALVYTRHAYGLGEHNNSVEPLIPGCFRGVAGEVVYIDTEQFLGGTASRYY
uniref:ubiquitinyl hydrolase 1 n=1 Tax=Leptobrachium leishanense TaxID=445787 RepID=A0A8C5PSS0_9ANUR